MEFRDRLRFLLNRDDVTAYRVWKDTSITKGTIGNYLEGKTKPNKSNIALLAAYFNISAQWLSTGEGEIQKNIKKNEEEPHLLTKYGVKYYEMSNGKYRMRVPFVPVKAYADYLDDFRDVEFMKVNYEEFDFIVDKIGNGRYFAFEIKGDSMDDDTKRSLSDGDIVLARELDKELWRDRLYVADYPNWIVVMEHTILCKQIVDHNVEKRTITCHSLNPSPEYSNFTLYLNDVKQICSIVQRVSCKF